ncbi:hypothetical protein E2C01_008618 [Portunus trituberculatus]|uniref:Uncharacterized protein n=1 Tax=Portunus trituberculatus TaxID=210409 RepID=A0A5B7D3B7_PORTR|nr:hypothetical protein [Portunus trituberculatus]
MENLMLNLAESQLAGLGPGSARSDDVTGYGVHAHGFPGKELVDPIQDGSATSGGQMPLCSLYDLHHTYTRRWRIY